MSDPTYEKILESMDKVNDEIQRDAQLEEELYRTVRDKIEDLVNNKDEATLQTAVERLAKDLVQEGFHTAEVVEYVIATIEKKDGKIAELFKEAIESATKEQQLKEREGGFDLMFDDLTEEAQADILAFVGVTDPDTMNWGTIPIITIPRPGGDEDVTAEEPEAPPVESTEKTKEETVVDEDKYAKIKKEKAAKTKKEKEEKEKAKKAKREKEAEEKEKATKDAKAEKEKKAKAKESKVTKQEVKAAEELLKSNGLNRKDDTTDEQVVEAAKSFTQIADIKKKTNEATDVSRDVKELIKLTKDALNDGDYVKAADLATRLSTIQQTIPPDVDADKTIEVEKGDSTEKDAAEDENKEPEVTEEPEDRD